MSAVEVRFENLSVDADVHVGGRALPTVLNSVLNFVEVTFRDCMLEYPGTCDSPCQPVLLLPALSPKGSIYHSSASVCAVM